MRGSCRCRLLTTEYGEVQAGCKRGELSENGYEQVRGLGGVFACLELSGPLLYDALLLGCNMLAKRQCNSITHAHCLADHEELACTGWVEVRLPIGWAVNVSSARQA
jgi:hypothetical protein